ncbi:DUF1963 domain-containing protein [Actinomadura rubrobrunea]|nr:DUF1963 domain-containing protein [Actinomadura rubrobrunea]
MSDSRSVSPCSPPRGNRRLLPEDLDAMLAAAVREVVGMSDADRDELTDMLRALVRPAWVLSAVDDRDAGEPGEIGRSRIGGLPDLPRDWRWPTARPQPDAGGSADDAEVSLAFIAQIDLAEAPGVADAGWLPSSGRLWFFHNGESEPNHVVLYADVPRHELRTARPPADVLDLVDACFLLDEPHPVDLHRTLFLTADYQTGWHSQGFEALEDALDERFGEDGAGYDLLAEIQDHLIAAAVTEGPWDGMLMGRPTPCPPPEGSCPCGRSAPADAPGYNDVSGPCSWANDSLLALYGYWGDGPLVYTADANVAPRIDGRRFAATEAWIY